MEEGLSESFPFMAHPLSLVPPTSAVPESFLQPSTSGVRRSPKKPPTGTQSRYTGKSDSSVQDSSGSSNEERRRRHNKLRDLTKTSSLIAKRAGDSPPRTSADERRTSSCRHQFRPRDTQSAQRRESSPRTSSLDGSPHQDERRVRAPPSNNSTKEPVMASPDDRRTTSCRHKSRPRDIQSDQRRESSPRTGSLDGSPHRDERQVRAPPSDNFTKEPVPSSRAFKRTESSVDKDKNDRGSRPSGGARDHSSRQRRTEEADDEAELPTEYSAYTLIRSYNSLVEPIPQEEEDWTSGLNKFLGEHLYKRSPL
ncbi:nuclear speckle splicing regulatory protein 1-like [Palaemon carinicauda]|uniref:nuclear speckle splicing regulatory protein 1-like n=1 Tax=Palaemon carinicauda TaxID=392227 RepID=UPI0035B65B87